MKTMLDKKNRLRKSRAMRVRKKLSDVSTKLRLSVFRSNTNLYGQIIDDEKGETLLSLSTLDKQFSTESKSKRNKSCAEKLGDALAKMAIEKGIKEVKFDRGPYKFHGVVKSFADAARTAGLVF